MDELSSLRTNYALLLACLRLCITQANLLLLTHLLLLLDRLILLSLFDPHIPGAFPPLPSPSLNYHSLSFQSCLIQLRLCCLDGLPSLCDSGIPSHSYLSHQLSYQKAC
ncbi:uncharacterized protein BO97DRAFT_372891 [Aspergillus homomorphus CBS 101889]|uniref:Uncharacterized protein n=1 Tax=Aspergillus homomorphus (strain CBS 101889) TaxID=1450537 RepID=A0A395HR95_ASPHC|nr:hypothetical protein BO97DRAFT_372891 [Aspergillus homomorphus CBS 101889]RAL10337.1 hypothetical protein BO97DRAFT_372891 [Aspergillus homomorphus CBS 101889]